MGKKKKIQRNIQLTADQARLDWLKDDEQECLDEIKAYQDMQKRYAKYPTIVFEIRDEVQKAKDGLALTRMHIRVLEEQIDREERIKVF